MGRWRAVLGVTLLAAGCGAAETPTDEGQLRLRAGFDFGCAGDALTLTHLGGTGAPYEQWGAAGCGQRAVYRCVTRDTTVSHPRGVCVWQREPTAVSADAGGA